MTIDIAMAMISCFFFLVQLSALSCSYVFTILRSVLTLSVGSFFYASYLSDNFKAVREKLLRKTPSSLKKLGLGQTLSVLYLKRIFFWLAMLLRSPSKASSCDKRAYKAVMLPG